MPRKRRHPSERLRDNSSEYPADGTGHSYPLKDIPLRTWKAAIERARLEKRSLRWVLIRLLEEYSSGRPLKEFHAEAKTPARAAQHRATP